MKCRSQIGIKVDQKRNHNSQNKKSSPFCLPSFILTFHIIWYKTQKWPEIFMQT